MSISVASKASVASSKASKIFDIVQPRDNWERGYAHLAYLHTGLKQTFDQRIPVELKAPVKTQKELDSEALASHEAVLCTSEYNHRYELRREWAAERAMFGEDS